MSVQAVDQRPERPEIKAAYDAAKAAYDQAEASRVLYADLEEARTRAESFERTAAITAKENESLLAQLRRTKGERDHYMRCFTALSAQMKGLGSAFIDAVNMANVHGYGERGAPAEQEPQAEHDLPSIVRRGPAMRGSPVRA